MAATGLKAMRELVRMGAVTPEDFALHHGQNKAGSPWCGVMWSTVCSRVWSLPAARHILHRGSMVSWCDRSFLQAAVVYQLVAIVVAKFTRNSARQGRSADLLSPRTYHRVISQGSSRSPGQKVATADQG